MRLFKVACIVFVFCIWLVFLLRVVNILVALPYIYYQIILDAIWPHGTTCYYEYHQDHMLVISLLTISHICMISLSPTNTSPPFLLPFILYLCMTSPVAGQAPRGKQNKAIWFLRPYAAPTLNNRPGETTLARPSPTTALFSVRTTYWS